MKTKRLLRYVTLLALLIATIGGGLCEESPFAGLPLIGDAAPRDAQKFSFAILGDKTSGGDGQWDIFDRAVDAINLLDPDFVITVGDQIPGHMQDRAQWDREWTEYLDHARRLKPPLLLIPGNHDIANIECYQFWKEDFGPTYYAFNYGGCHFLILNTEEERWDGRGPVWEAMMTFAEENLAAHTDARHTFVFFHKPMWDDPRYEEDWRRLEKALHGRAYTVVAGHEHYLMTERRAGHLLTIQSATGGGLAVNNIKEYGAFHSFGFVTVQSRTTTYAVIEPGGGIWPVEIAPASFRKAIAYDMVQLDAEQPVRLDSATAEVFTQIKMHNVLAEPATIEAVVSRLDGCEWEPKLTAQDDAVYTGSSLALTRTLAPGERCEVSVPFTMSRARLSFPPRVSWRVEYRGEWLPNENYDMSQENTVLIYPASCFRIVPEWQLVGPFPLGEIDTNHLPDNPAQANARFFERFGPEDGYDAARVYEGGRRWFPVKNQGRGLLNFNALMGTIDHALGYALCGIYSPTEQHVHALVYSDNYHQVVLNGVLLEEGQDFGAPSGFTYVPLDLQPGWNTLIAKLMNNRGDWFLRVLIADPENNLRFARTPSDNAP